MLRETDSQFQKRLQLLHKPGVSVNDARRRYKVGPEAEKICNPAQNNSSIHVSQVSVRPQPSTKKAEVSTKVVEMNVLSISRSSKIIAKYYRTTEIKRERKRKQFAADVICRHIYAVIQEWRLSKLMYSIVSVQAVVRGFFVRHNFKLLSNLLKQRNFMFKVARRKFRRWLHDLAKKRRERVLLSKPNNLLSDPGAEVHASNSSANPERSPSPSPIASRLSDLGNVVAAALGAKRSPKPDSFGLPLHPPRPDIHVDISRVNTNSETIRFSPSTTASDFFGSRSTSTLKTHSFASSTGMVYHNIVFFCFNTSCITANDDLFGLRNLRNNSAVSDLSSASDKVKGNTPSAEDYRRLQKLDGQARVLLKTVLIV